VPRVVSRTASGSPLTHAFECDVADITVLDNLAGDLTLTPPVCTGTNPEPEQEIEYRFFSSTPRVLTWNAAAFCENNGIPFLGSTTGDGVTFDRIKFRRNAQSGCWGVIATTRGVGRGVTTLASSTTYTCDPRLAARCEMQMTAAAGTLTVAAPLGTPANGDTLWLAFQCTNAQTFAWHAIFLNGIYQTKPVTCPANVATWLEVLVRYSTVESGWVILVGASAGGSALTVQEIDGTPTGTFSTLRFSNGSMTDNGGGTATIVTSGTSTFTVTKNIPITGVKFPTTNPARLDRSGNTDKLLFDGATPQCVMWQFPWPSDATAGGTMRLNGSMASATSGSVKYDFAVWKLTPGATADVDTEDYDAVNACNTATVPSVAGRLFTVSCALTNKDSVVAGDNTLLRLCRDTATDTATGDGEVEALELAYTH
jgi:hypothetical protein